MNKNLECFISKFKQILRQHFFQRVFSLSFCFQKQIWPACWTNKYNLCLKTRWKRIRPSFGCFTFQKLCATKSNRFCVLGLFKNYVQKFSGFETVIKVEGDKAKNKTNFFDINFEKYWQQRYCLCVKIWNKKRVIFVFSVPIFVVAYQLQYNIHTYFR